MAISTIWFLILGSILLLIGVSQTLLKRLPLTSSFVYLAIGLTLGAHGWGLISLEVIRDAKFLEILTEIVVIVSLFTAGLKLRHPFVWKNWDAAIRLATLSMVITVGLIAAASYFFLHLPLGAAILLGAILAPTDPVLASDVQVQSATDRDRLRFSLTGEAGLNDGTAFPFVMLGLGLLGVHDLGNWGWRWFAVDLAWACTAGLAVGAALGTLVASFVIRTRLRDRDSKILDDFICMGLIAISYGVAIAIHSYGFLAVFAAGLAFRRVERLHSGAKGAKEPEQAKETEAAPAVHTTEAVLVFNEQVERIGEVGTVLLLGGMLTLTDLKFPDFWLVPVIFLLIRPLAVGLGLLGSRMSEPQRVLTSWFGIRGIGSLYYLTYAINRGMPMDIAERLTSLVLVCVTLSVLVHGLSVTPLMDSYQRFSKRTSRNQR